MSNQSTSNIVSHQSSTCRPMQETGSDVTDETSSISNQWDAADEGGGSHPHLALASGSAGIVTLLLLAVLLAVFLLRRKGLLFSRKDVIKVENPKYISEILRSGSSCRYSKGRILFTGPTVNLTPDNCAQKISITSEKCSLPGYSDYVAIWRPCKQSPTVNRGNGSPSNASIRTTQSDAKYIQIMSSTQYGISSRAGDKKECGIQIGSVENDTRKQEGERIATVYETDCRVLDSASPEALLPV